MTTSSNPTAPAGSEHGAPPTLHVYVEAPKSDEQKAFDWTQTKKVGEAAREAATAFGYEGATPGFQTTETPARQLDNDKPLVAEHVKSGDVLELVDLGGGV